MSVEIFAEGEGLKDLEVFQFEDDAPAQRLLEEVARKGGYTAAEAYLFAEDAQYPIELSGVKICRQMAGAIHHVHRAKLLDVEVFYGKGDIKNRFSPATRIQRVLNWATSNEGFNIDTAIAPEMELALHGTTEALPKSAHIGRYANHPDHEVKFDLIRGIIPNGADDDA